MFLPRRRRRWDKVIEMVDDGEINEATQVVNLVKANVDCEKTMKTRSMMVSVNKMMNLQAVDLVKNKLETRWPDCQWNVTHFKSFSLRKDRISL